MMCKLLSADLVDTRHVLCEMGQNSGFNENFIECLATVMTELLDGNDHVEQMCLILMNGIPRQIALKLQTPVDLIYIVCTGMKG
jgi:hypothetical protein